MSKLLITIGLTLDIVGVLLLAAGLVSGRKGRILQRINWLKESEEMRESLVDGYERLRQRHHDNRANPDIEFVNSIEWLDNKIDGYIEDVNKGRNKVYRKTSNELEELKTELDFFQTKKEKAGLLLLLLGFLLQLIGTVNS